MALQDSGVRGSYGRDGEGTLERVVGWHSDAWKTTFLAGSMGGCPCPKSRGREILRSVLRPIFQTVLRTIFQPVLRNRGCVGGSGRAKGSGDRLKLVTALGLGGFEDFRDDRMVNTHPVRNHGFP